MLRDLLGDGTGAIRSDLAPLYQALTGDDRPDSTLAWLNGTKVHDLLSRIGRAGQPVSHLVLDELPAGKTLEHLRSILIATGTLPPRDERLTGLERWITMTTAARADPAERKILHGYAVWHHVRRLRRRLGDEHASHLQALNVRCHVTAAVSFLDWLTANDLTLGGCTQPDLDRWISQPGHSYRDETGHFVRWAVKHRHANGLSYGTIDTEKRWDDARRLLHDDTLRTSDRVAGLDLLLYAQQVVTIASLTTSDIRLDDGIVSITFGSSPVILPEPLAGLVRELVATRSGKARIGAPGQVPWLFPGGRPGQPIGYDRLCQRLKIIGLQPRQDRSTALFTLAAELPAAVLARMLGIHIAVAVQWQKASAGDWSAYAADVSRRPRQEHPSPSPRRTLETETP